MAATFRFLQFSDVHLDSRLTGSRLAWPKEKREQRIREIAEAARKACHLARERDVEALLLPGDLWDDETISAETIAQLIDAFAALDPIPVFIAPGNHDFYSPTSPYNGDVLRARGLPTWPKNVHIFRSSEFETIRHPARSEVTITGRAFLENVRLEERLLRNPIPRPPARVSVLLFHGSWIEYAGRDRFEEDKLFTAPFSRGELLAQGFSYAALGHYHHYAEIRDDDGRVRAAYAGCLAGRYLSEAGPHFALLGEIDERGIVALKKIPVDERTILDVEVDVTGAEDEASVRERIRQKLRECGARSTDIVFLRLRGRRSRGLHVTATAEEFQQEHFHLAIADLTRPAYELDRADPRTVQGRFIHEMQRRIAAASDPRERALLERALTYGLDALLQGTVEPIYEE
ncbi:MAG: DNA repair exonuclease [Blastocatellia bacterium]|nr:DNA repair exonuclease [Blastocatellia bacterium]MDW8168691.1 DNA repair exonuclease [Acidobacteriota bacterium]